MVWNHQTVFLISKFKKCFNEAKLRLLRPDWQYRVFEKQLKIVDDEDDRLILCANVILFNANEFTVINSIYVTKKHFTFIVINRIKKLQLM